MNDPRNIRVLDAAYALVELVHSTAYEIDVHAVPGLRAQLLGAVDGIAANISEGARRGSNAQFAQFLRMARSSADETGTHLQIAYRAGALDQRRYWLCNARRLAVAKMLSALIREVEEQAARAENAQR